MSKAELTAAVDAVRVTPRKDDWFTREQIDEVVAGLSAGDLIEAMGDSDTIKGTRMIGIAFDAAAARLGMTNGVSGVQRVRVSDFKYLAEKLGGAVNMDGPLSEGQEP